MMLQRTVAELAALVGGTVEGDGGRVVAALASPERAGPDDLAVVFRGELPDGCRAGALIVVAGFPATTTTGAGTLAVAAAGRSLIRVAHPERALDELLAALAPVDPGPDRGRHPSAVVEPGALVDGSAALGAHVFVGAGATIGARVVLWPGAVVARDAVVGADSVLRSRAVLEARCVLGERVVVHAGAIIGADGFGFREEGGRLVKSPQVGIVRVGDDVEIGANTTIDRARFEATEIGNGTKIDDGVHIAHNCRIGAHCALAGQVALSGGAQLGDGVRMGGRSGTTVGVRIAAGTVVGGLAIVMKDVDEPCLLLGQPARPAAAWQRSQAALARLPRVLERLRSSGTSHGS